VQDYFRIYKDQAQTITSSLIVPKHSENDMVLLYTTNLSTSDVKLAKVAHGLMLLTWRTPVVDDDTAFEALKAGLDLLGPGDKVLWNSAEFYGVDPPTANLELLSRFFAKYPEYQDRAFISVKGGTLDLKPVSTLENLRRSVVDSAKALGGVKKIDLFEPARLDGVHSIEEISQSLKTLVDEGLISYIGLSEVNADTLRRACKVTQVHVVEIEVSPWCYDDKVKEVIATAKELSVNVVAYAPLGRGFLTGTIKREDLSKDDFRLQVPRFEAEHAAANQSIVDALTALAKKKGVTNAQLCIAWVASLGDHVIPLPGSSKVTRTLENFAAANIVLSPEEKEEIDAAVASFVVSGERYPAYVQGDLMK